jgi:hypothetical protein
MNISLRERRLRARLLKNEVIICELLVILVEIGFEKNREKFLRHLKLPKLGPIKIACLRNLYFVA